MYKNKDINKIKQKRNINHYNNKINNLKKFNIKFNIIYTCMFTLILIIVDFITKRYFLLSKNIINLIILKLNLIINTGASFGLLKGYNTVFIIISVIVLIILIYNHKKIPLFSFILIVSGITGNLIDRIELGYVIDFIDFGFWPVFNFADCYISIGIIIWIIKISENEIKNIKNNKYKKQYKNEFKIH